MGDFSSAGIEMGLGEGRSSCWEEESGERGRLGLGLRKCSRSRPVWTGKPLEVRRRSSQVEPGLLVGIEQSIFLSCWGSQELLLLCFVCCGLRDFNVRKLRKKAIGREMEGKESCRPSSDNRIEY